MDLVRPSHPKHRCVQSFEDALVMLSRQTGVAKTYAQYFVSRPEVVRPRGFEPLTFCSGGKRSIQAELRARNQELKEQAGSRNLLPVKRRASMQNSLSPNLSDPRDGRRNRHGRFAASEAGAPASLKCDAA